MKTMLSALAAVVLLSAAASAEEASKTKEAWAPGHAAHRISGTVTHHAAAVHPATAITGGRGFAPKFDASNHPSFGGSIGSSLGGTVQPLRAMPRSRTSGAGTFVDGPVQGRGYTAESAATMKGNAGGGTSIVAGKGRVLSGPGLTKGDADTPPGGAAAGSDPLSKIAAGIGNMFGDIAKAMTALWGGGS